MLLVTYSFAVYMAIESGEDRARFGEMFGAIEALFSGLAIAGVLYTIHAQRREIHSTREAFRSQMEIQMLTDGVNLLKHQLDMLLYDIELKSKLRLPVDSEVIKLFQELNQTLIEQYKMLDAKKAELATRLSC